MNLLTESCNRPQHAQLVCVGSDQVEVTKPKTCLYPVDSNRVKGRLASLHAAKVLMWGGSR